MTHHGHKEQLIDFLQEAHATEVNVGLMLNSMIQSTSDPQIVADLEHHKEETARHEQSLRDRLQAHGADTSKTKEAPGVLGAMAKGLLDQVREDKPMKNARDGFATEHVEIAIYQLLERLAQRAGDQETAEIARQNRADEEAMAEKIASTWDKVIDLTLEKVEA